MTDSPIIEDSIKNEIFARIKTCEQEHQVKIIFAVDSGSRAWGGSSPNSDYDVRYIYVHSQDWYLDIDVHNQRDVIEYPIVDEIDINGWDIRKALMLFWKSNPAIVEWIQSPVVYVDKGIFANQVKALLPEVYSLEKGIYHYKNMAKAGYRELLNKNQVSIKKYFYILRTLLAIRWIQSRHEPAPFEFDILLTLLVDDQDLTLAIVQLLVRKKIATEKEVGPRVPMIDDFIERELLNLENIAITPERNKLGVEVLNTLFRALIK